MSRSVWIPKEVSNGATSGIRIRRSSTASSASAFTESMLGAERDNSESCQPDIVVVAELQVRRRHVLFQLTNVRRARDRDHVRLMNYPGQSDLRATCSLLGADLAQRIDEGLRALPRLVA